MNRRQMLVGGAVVAVLVLAALVLFVSNRKAQDVRNTPDWLDPEQPPDGVAGQLGTVDPAQSWAANRAAPFAACCTGRTAGTRVRREYASTLADDPFSIVRSRVSLDLRASV